jgi:hypothetical protein
MMTMTILIMKLIIKHYQQPTGISCGPTCIMMAYQALPHYPKKQNYSIMEICDLCGTDSITGTPPARLEKGMNALGMHYTHHINSDKPFQHLKTILDNGNLPMLRTFTHGIPHWIIISGYENDKYYANDPWQGEMIYSEEELSNIWIGRHYEFYEVEMLVIKQGIPKERINEIMKWSFPYFTHVIDEGFFQIVVEGQTDLKKSAMIVDKDDNILGVYLIGNTQLRNLDFHDLKGVEGVLLAVDESIRGRGWGNRLKDYPKTLGVDYIWGQQAKGLNNIKDWLKRRELINESGGVYITAEIF